MNNIEEQIDSALTKWGAPKDTLSEIVLSYENNELGGSGNCSCEKLGVTAEKINQISVNQKTGEQLTEKMEILNSLVEKNKNLIYKLHGIDPNYKLEPFDNKITKSAHYIVYYIYYNIAPNLCQVYARI